MKIISKEEFYETLKTNNYGIQYLDLIQKVLLENRGLQRQVGYEKHHIHPISLGGEVKSESNQVKLTIYEHCQAHALLAKALPCYETLVPISRMSFKQYVRVQDVDKISLEETYQWSELRTQSCLVRRGRHLTPEHREKISKNRRGIPVSLETRRKISEKNKGRRHTEEEKRKVSEKLRGGNSTSWKKGRVAWNRGMGMSEASKEKLREKQKNHIKCYNSELDLARWVNRNELETFLQENPGWRVGGRPLTPEHREKLSKAKLGRVLPLEVKQKMSKSHTRTAKYANPKYEAESN